MVSNLKHVMYDCGLCGQPCVYREPMKINLKMRCGVVETYVCEDCRKAYEFFIAGMDEQFIKMRQEELKG